MNPSKSLIWLHCILASCLIAIAAPYAWYGWPTARSLKDSAIATAQSATSLPEATRQLPAVMTSIKGATDQLPATMMAIRAATADLPATMMSVKEAADTANDSSTEALNLTGSAVSLVDDLRAKIDDVIPKAGNTVAKLGTTADAATETFTRLGETADAGTALMSSAEMKSAIGNLGALEATLNTTTAHFDRKYLAPWDHAHPVRHYIGLTGKTILSVTGVGATLVRDTK